MKTRWLGALSGFVMIAAGTISAVAMPIHNTTNGHWYEYVAVDYNLNDPIWWEEAKTAAEEVGGYLATITSAIEDAWIWDNLGGTALLHSWLGGFQVPGSMEPAGGWQWVTSETWEYANWSDGGPNNFTENDPNGESVLMLGVWDFATNFWNDLDPHTLNNVVDYAAGYIVEWNENPFPPDAVPEPGTFALLGLGLLGLLGAARRRWLTRK